MEKDEMKIKSGKMEISRKLKFINFHIKRRKKIANLQKVDTDDSNVIKLID